MKSKGEKRLGKEGRWRGGGRGKGRYIKEKRDLAYIRGREGEV